MQDGMVSNPKLCSHFVQWFPATNNSVENSPLYHGIAHLDIFSLHSEQTECELTHENIFFGYTIARQQIRQIPSSYSKCSIAIPVNSCLEVSFCFVFSSIISILFTSAPM